MHDMKNNYINPRVTIIEISDIVDIVTASTEVDIVGGEQSGARQRNPIWDDYE